MQEQKNVSIQFRRGNHEPHYANLNENKENGKSLRQGNRLINTSTS